MSIQGIDVSSNNGAIDCAQVAAAGYQFGIVKLTEGTGYVNPLAVATLAGLSANQLGRGVYHFALPVSNSAADEAAWFLQQAKPLLQPGDVMVLDLEQDPYGGTLPADCGTWALTWLRAVEAAFGCKPLLYTNLDLIENYGVTAVAANGNGLWLAAPNQTNVTPPAPWSFLALQQTSWHGSVPGISGQVDLDEFFGDLAAFRRYGVPARPAPSPLALAQQAQAIVNQLVTALGG